MTLEFFWEPLILGRQGISGTEMPSTQNNPYAKMADGVAYPNPPTQETRKRN